MMTQGQHRILIEYLLTFILLIFLAGCSGGGGDSPALPDGSGSGEKTPGGELPGGGGERPDIPDVPREEVPNTVINSDTIAIEVIDLGWPPPDLDPNNPDPELEQEWDDFNNRVIRLDGSGWSTSNGEALSYSWSFISKPDGSAAVLRNDNTDTVEFTVDVYGAYLVEMVVSADGLTDREIGQAYYYDRSDVNSPREAANHDGMPSWCVECHDGVETNRQTGELVAPKSGDHMATSNMCQNCHTSFGFEFIAHFDHLDVVGSCSECHNGEISVGKSDFHSATEEECDECHNTTDFVDRREDGSFDHSNIASACSACHNGNYIIGKHEGHVETTASCNQCHATDAWDTAVIDHNSPSLGACFTCHYEDNATVTGRDDVPDKFNHPHPATSDDCSICHNTRSFEIIAFDHGTVDYNNQRCDSCHNDVNAPSAPGVPPGSNNHPDLQIGATNEFHDCGMCHYTDTFVWTEGFDHTLIDFTTTTCVSCHNNDPGSTASGTDDAPVGTHIPITEDCGACHTPGTFASGTFDHDPLTETCRFCHTNEIDNYGDFSVGMTINHIPIANDQDCNACHNDTVDFANVTFNHDGITNDCASCHDGNIATGTKVNHIPIQDDCSVCHTDTANFANSVFLTEVHTGITADCASCHDGLYATGKISGHIPTRDDCSVCHTDVSNFTSVSFDHTGVTRGCGGCHNGNFTDTNGTPNVLSDDSIRGKPATLYGHLPTDQDCYICHDSTSDWTITSFDHQGISGNCESCHNGNYNGGFGARGKADVPDPVNNPHPETTSDCNVCHNTLDFADAFVDHSSPDVLNQACSVCHDDPNVVGRDKPANHLETTQDCGLCHTAGGSFIPAVVDHNSDVVVNQTCISCHDGIYATGIADKTGTPHVALRQDQDCDNCHTTTTFAGAQFDHTGILDNCTECHDGQSAIGKDNNHIPTNDDCAVCHVTTGFIPAQWDHDGIVDNCRSCHDGTIAQGKSQDHVETNQDCGVCHNTTAFIPATFDHTGIVDGCVTCHDGTIAIGKTNNHVQSNDECQLCHSTATFAGANFDHQGITDGCSDCHSGDEPQDHFNFSGTNVDCNGCHSTDRWSPARDFDHCPNTNSATCSTSDYPGDHRVNPGCTQCHRQNAAIIDPYPTPQYANPFTCAACHANDFDNGEHNGGLARNADCGDSGCHSVNDRNWD